MSGSTTHIDNDEESIKKSMEEYSQELFKDGWSKDSEGYKSLMGLHHHLISTPQEELNKEFAEINAMGTNGPTVEEYFESTNPQAMYAKGYKEGAKRYKDLVEQFFKEWIAPINEQKKSIHEGNKKLERTGTSDKGFIFVSPGVSFIEKNVDVYFPPIEEIIVNHILPKLQEIFDNN